MDLKKPLLLFLCLSIILHYLISMEAPERHDTKKALSIALAQAINKGDYEAAEETIKKGADVNYIVTITLTGGIERKYPLIKYKEFLLL